MHDLHFNAYARGPGTVYYDIDKSISIASELLMYQFENNEGVICRFLQTLVDVLDKKIPKRNSMLIYSPPSAGKNYFFDVVAAFFLNYGMFGTANDYGYIGIVSDPIRSDQHPTHPIFVATSYPILYRLKSNIILSSDHLLRLLFYLHVPSFTVNTCFGAVST
jgi:hypothetical protein